MPLFRKFVGIFKAAGVAIRKRLLGGLPAVYVEDVFSTYLYTGNGSTQTITNGINLSTNGGLVWIKGRNNGWNNILQDTNRGINSSLCTNNTDGAIDPAGVYLTSFNSNGFSIGTNGSVNFNTNTYVSWTFRKQPKFYTQGTYTGTGSVQNITHDLGSVPGCIIVKDTTNNGSAWAVYHRSNGNTKYMWLNSDAAPATSAGYWNNTDPTSTEFTVGTNGNVNQSGATFVYYAFAHNAGGFGLTGTDNVITCGRVDAKARVQLGYQPQWILSKPIGSDGPWEIADTMRGMYADFSGQVGLYPNSSATESTDNYFKIDATGFTPDISSFIYIAIRRGPMKVPTSGTSVFAPLTRNGTGAAASVTTVGFPPDMAMVNIRDAGTRAFVDKLRGPTQSVAPAETAAERTSPSTKDISSFNQNGISFAGGSDQYSSNSSGLPYVNWYLRRAPGFFDEVCYTGTNSGGSSQTISHNLGVAPELTIFKKRAAVSNWTVAMPAIGGNAVSLNLNDVGASSNIQFIDTYGASSITTASGYDTISENTTTYVAYLFATCAGVSKVGSYTGTGTTLQVNCGFTGGARFVLIKRTDSTGDWYVWDTARGIVSGNDPYLLLNSTAAEVTNTDYIDTYSAGFELSSTAPAALNANGGTYIFLAIA